MFTFPELIKKIRKEVGFTQAQFAKSIGVSSVLIAMIESGQKDVSKNLLKKIAKKLKVHPASITPFLYGFDIDAKDRLSILERRLLSWGSKLQDFLIKDRSKLLIDHEK